MSWVKQIFEADAVRSGGVVHRSRGDVSKYASIQELVAEAKRREYHVVEACGQVVVFCRRGPLETMTHC